uniref:Uncharacterized protein n=1 Tax=Candidatus Kentrum sp. DK TaxID=2126562 RepID=A0A450T788_9GAMM|nr:MAG: hypothetical protein BECKDK2373C_GA0170839_10999 [Candidatus Kentron sp. DK]
MNITYETINLLVLLVPGFISSGIYSLLSRKTDTNTFNRVMESLVFAFFIYIAIHTSYSWEPLLQATKSGQSVVYRFSDDRLLIFLTLIFTLVFPLIWGTIVYRDWHMKLLRWAKLTERTSRDTAWDDVFISERRFITLHLVDGRRITGWPLYYSNNKDQGFIFISKAKWIDDENQYVDTGSFGILISRDKIGLTEFMGDNYDRE